MIKLQTPQSIEFLSYDKITKTKVKKYLKYVRFDEDGETILIKHLGEEFILPKFEDRPESFRWTSPLSCYNPND